MARMWQALNENDSQRVSNRHVVSAWQRGKPKTVAPGLSMLGDEIIEPGDNHLYNIIACADISD